MNSFICLLVQVATSFCKHFRLHTTSGPTQKALTEIKPTAGERVAKESVSSREKGSGGLCKAAHKLHIP